MNNRRRREAKAKRKNRRELQELESRVRQRELTILDAHGLRARYPSAASVSEARRYYMSGKAATA